MIVREKRDYPSVYKKILERRRCYALPAKHLWDAANIIEQGLYWMLTGKGKIELLRYREPDTDHDTDMAAELDLHARNIAAAIRFLEQFRPPEKGGGNAG